MPAPRLAVSADQRVVFRVEKEHLRAQAVAFQLGEGTDRVTERSEGPHVEGARRVPATGFRGQRDERTRQHRRSVVETCEAKVLKRFHRLTLARTREPRYDD